jgi:hypothetical protein
MQKKTIYHHGSEGRGIFTIGKCGPKFKILKCSKQTLSPFPPQSTLDLATIGRALAGEMSLYAIVVFSVLPN